MEVIGISDEDSANDNASVISSVSGSTIYEDARKLKNISKLSPAFSEHVSQRSSYCLDTGDEIEANQFELFEDKLSEAIEGMYEKSLQGRINSIESVSAALMKKFIPDYVCSRYNIFSRFLLLALTTSKRLHILGESLSPMRLNEV